MRGGGKHGKQTETNIMGYYKKLPERQHAVMEAWKEEEPQWGYYYIFTLFGIAMRALKIEEPSETQVKRVRKTVRLLARKGYLEISQRWNEYSGLFCGSGYQPTHKGVEYIKEHVVEQEEKNDENL